MFVLLFTLFKIVQQILPSAIRQILINIHMYIYTFEDWKEIKLSFTTNNMVVYIEIPNKSHDVL